MEISGKLHVQLALGVADIDGEISGAYKVSTNNTRNTHSLILTLRQTSSSKEIPKSRYNGKEKEFNKGILSAAALNDDATHIVTYIEYGSQLHIECLYEGINKDNFCKVKCFFFQFFY